MLSLDENNAFVTTFITKPEVRGHGIGTKVWAACKEAIAGKNLIVNAAPNKDQMYNKLGFIPSECRMQLIDYRFLLKRTDNFSAIQDVAQMLDYDQSLFEKVYMYDKGMQPLERKVFLKNNIEKSEKAKIALKNGEVVGYACLRKTYKGYMIQPLFADGADIAKQLLKELVQDLTENEQIKVAFPSSNTKAAEVFKEIGWSDNPAYVILRMHTKKDLTHLIDQTRVYAVMSLSYTLI